MYLNTIFYGNQSFGVEAAAQTYFGTSARRLDLAQSAFIAGLPQRPSYLNPFLTEGYVHARDRQHDVLSAMVRDGYITAAAADKAYAEDLGPKLAAAHQAWDPAKYDEIVVCTLPTGASKWLQVDLPHRLQKLTDAPVTHVVAHERNPAAATTS